MIELHPLQRDEIRIPIEQIVSDHRGKRWAVQEFRDMDDFSSHPSAILSDGSYAVFAKLSKAANGLEQFELELAGLRLLSELSGVSTPSPIGNLPVEGGVIMVLEALQSVDRTANH